MPAIEMEKITTTSRNGKNFDFVNRVSLINVTLVIEEIRKRSSILKKLEENGLIMITGGLYDIDNGSVSFF
jgi:carbonic anhydrase